MNPIQKILILLATAVAFCGHARGADQKPEAMKKLPESAKFILAEDPKLGIDPPKEGRVLVGKNPARIKVVPGLADPQCASLMSDRDVYLLHRDWKIRAEKRPEDAQGRRTFDANATFKVTYLPNGDVRFEAKNRPGEFIVVEEDRNLSLSKPLDGLRLNFRVEAKPVGAGE